MSVFMAVCLDLFLSISNCVYLYLIVSESISIYLNLSIYIYLSSYHRCMEYLKPLLHPPPGPANQIPRYIIHTVVHFVLFNIFYPYYFYNYRLLQTKIQCTKSLGTAVQDSKLFLIKTAA